MILEAKQMLESLEAAGWDLSVTHPDLKRPGKAISILATINDSATQIISIDILSAEQTASRWTQANAGHNNFPVNKIKGPLLKAREKSELEIFSRERDDTKRAAIIRNWLEEAGPLALPQSPFSKGLQSKLKERLEALSKLESSPASQYLRLMQLVSSVTQEQGSFLLFQILEKLQHLSLEGAAVSKKDAQKLLINLLFTPKDKSSVPIVWNLPGKGLNGVDSSSPENFTVINTALLSENKNDSASIIQCALTGVETTGVGDKFPQPTFPGVGKTYLFARNKQTPSLGRYGVSGTDSYQIGENCANQLASALSALTQPYREEKTWIKIPSDKPKKSDLLVVFQGGEEDRKLALALGDIQTVYGESAFEELTNRVLERTKGKAIDQIRGHMLVAIISAVDTGNRKVILNRQIDSSSLEKCAQRWEHACESFPGRPLPLSFAKGEKPKNIASVVISPGTIPALTKAFHFTDGRVSPDTSGGVTFAESLELLLNISEPHNDHKRLLSITYQRLGNLLVRVASTHYRQPSQINKIKTSDKWICLRAQSLFAILLTSLNRPFNIVMNSLPYQLGQLCASFDTLHAAYCYIERGGSMPPRLIGNNCFQASNRNPISALGQLSSRAAPYLSRLNAFKGNVANEFLAKCKDDFDATQIIWTFLKLRSRLPTAAQNLAESLSSNLVTVTDLFRCELLLGYLSGPILNETTSETEPNTTPTNS